MFLFHNRYLKTTGVRAEAASSTPEIVFDVSGFLSSIALKRCIHKI
jgi:hypothetical protein